jgi:hypothetical protein
MAKGLTKKLVDEAYPLGIYLCHEHGDAEDLLANIVAGNQQYDAIVREPTCESFVEITQAHEGYDHHLRMLVLERDGGVNMLGRVTTRGTKNTGLAPQVENVALPHRTVLENEITRIEEAIDRKRAKVYPTDTTLLVMFDDRIAFNYKLDEDIKILRSRIDPLLDSLSQFRSVAIVGWSGKARVDFDIAP